jgi:RHH-type proline utilization regulon transcriptional repressor/proline dehydrogenase/delta 1-pyrroline-5-carboxylate dehydrogenase
LISVPNADRLRALTTLEEGEEWLLAPVQDSDNPCLWSPGIKLGVQPGSFLHQTEIFAPLLAVMRAQDLDHAMALVNGTPYGLTSGLHSLDERERKRWVDTIEAGNLYINRGITGAVVQRQPFGGCKDSSFGPGAKAGGPNYLINLMHPRQIALPQESEELKCKAALFAQMVGPQLKEDEQDLWLASVRSYSFYWKHLFSQVCDVSNVVGQDNLLFYRPQKVALRIQNGDAAIDIWRSCLAALVCGASLEVSSDDTVFDYDVGSLGITTIVETDYAFAARLKTVAFPRVRLLQPPESKLQYALAQLGARVIL